MFCAINSAYVWLNGDNNFTTYFAKLHIFVLIFQTNGCIGSLLILSDGSVSWFFSIPQTFLGEDPFCYKRQHWDVKFILIFCNIVSIFPSTLWALFNFFKWSLFRIVKTFSFYFGFSVITNPFSFVMFHLNYIFIHREGLKTSQ